MAQEMDTLWMKLYKLFFLGVQSKNKFHIKCQMWSRYIGSAYFTPKIANFKCVQTCQIELNGLSGVSKTES